jgi:hypothetical protein
MSDRAIESSLMLRTAFRLALRRAVGFMKSVLNFESVLRRCMNEGLLEAKAFAVDCAVHAAPNRSFANGLREERTNDGIAQQVCR